MGDSYGEFNSNWRLDALVRTSRRPSRCPPSPHHNNDDGHNNHTAAGTHARRWNSKMVCITLEGLGEFQRTNKLWNSSFRTEAEPQCPPWAAMVAFSALFAAILHDYSYIAVANERSANYGNTTYLGTMCSSSYLPFSPSPGFIYFLILFSWLMA